jgi:hypothetical protein
LTVPVLLEEQGQDNSGCTVKHPDDNLDVHVFDPFNHILQEEYLSPEYPYTISPLDVSRFGHDGKGLEIGILFPLFG